MVMTGMEQYNICRIKPVEAVDLRLQKLHILTAETTMIKRPDPTFTLTRTDKIKLIPGWCGEDGDCLVRGLKESTGFIGDGVLP